MSAVCVKMGKFELKAVQSLAAWPWVALYLLLFSHQVVSNSFSTPWTVAVQAPLSMGCPEHGREYWSELPFPSPRDLPNPGIKPESPLSPALTSGFFTTEPPGKAPDLLGYWLKTSLNLSAPIPWLWILFCYQAELFIYTHSSGQPVVQLVTILKIRGTLPTA